MPRLYYMMAVDGLEDAKGGDPLEEAVELELDLGEDENLPGAARCEVPSGLLT